MQGLYADTNARYLAERLSELGLEVRLTSAAPDDRDAIESLVRFAAASADLVICTGGLGPTEDDLNREVFAQVFGLRLVEDAEALARMRDRFARRGRVMPESNGVQALVPEGAVVLQNDWGTAPGFFLDPAAAGETVCALAALPGPPKELIPMFEHRLLPLITGRCGDRAVVTRMLHTFGMPESELNDLLKDLFRREGGVSATILARPYGVDFRVTACSSTRKDAAALAESVLSEAAARIPERILYGRDGITLAQAAGALLRERGRTVAVAESCTGGLIAKSLTDIAGSSAFFLEGVVSYSNAAKVRLLGVHEETLAEHGAVSAETAREMAAGVRDRSGADYGIAVTGIAGPDGGTAEKPVGLVFIGVADAKSCRAFEHRFTGDREQNRLWASQAALSLLRRQVLRGGRGQAA